MTSPLHFMMGQHKAVIPTDRFYSARHMWLKPIDSGTFQVGFTSYSIRLLQDVYFLEWTVDENTPVRDRQEIGEIESSKAVSTMYTPCAGTILQFNAALLNDPSGINADNYGAGWLYTFQTGISLLSAEDYVRVLENGWEETQRAIKGQMNEG